MSLANLLLKIDSLQRQIDANGNLDEAVKKRIQYKFRLDWNYYSNAMEGNSLTKQETRSVMMNNITINGKPIRDVMEVKGHDDAVLEILKISKGEVRLSEKRILEMHKAIIHEEDPEKEGQVGRWKTGANFMQNYRGERFDFLAPELVADAMHELLNKTNAQIDAFYHAKKESWHPAVIAFYFHLEYVKIHPFYDGNGRTARLLMNLLLISFGFPPVILNLENKERYYSLLTDIQGYGGNPDLFYEFMGELLIQSQEMVLDAIAGKDISEEDDLDKEIALFKKQLEKIEEFLPFSNNAAAQVYQRTLSTLFQSIIHRMSQFDELFAFKTIYNEIDRKSTEAEGVEIFDDLFMEIDRRQNLRQDMDLIDLHFSDPIKDVHNINLRIVYNGFKNDGVNTFSEYYVLHIYFNDFNYVINDYGQNSDKNNLAKKLYTETLSSEEFKNILNQSVSKFFAKIKSNMGNK
jgi:Fic family protein